MGWSTRWSRMPSQPMEYLYGRIRIASQLIENHMLMRDGQWLRPVPDADTWEGVFYAYNTGPERVESRELVRVLRSLAGDLAGVADLIAAMNDKPFPQTGE